MSKFALTEDENNSINMPAFLVKKLVSTGFPHEPPVEIPRTIFSTIPGYGCSSLSMLLGTFA